MNRQRGMTLVELLVSMAIVLVITGAATAAYLKLLRGYKTQSKISENYMANLTGLELLRYDIEMAGFGLPTGLSAGATYSEAASAVSPYDPSTLNDSTSNVPRAFVHLNNSGDNGSDVLAIKSAAANINTASKKWSMVTLATGGGVKPKVKAWGGASLDSVLDFTANDNFIVLDNSGNLLPAAAGPYTCYSFSGTTPTSGYYSDATAISSALNTQNIYLIYGLDTTAGTHRMPFNRVDYYLDKVTGQFPSSCAASTYTLYRATINQADGTRNASALLDCVRDFQVAFGLDNVGDGNVHTWVQALGTMDAATIKAQVREVRVFLLFQEGTGDTSKNPDFRFSGILNLGDQDIAHGLDSANYSSPPNGFQQLSSTALTGTPQLSSFTPAGIDKQYRWKALEMSIKPMNLK